MKKDFVVVIEGGGAQHVRLHLNSITLLTFLSVN